MKVEKAETKFTPVVITLESQEEVDQMFALAYHMCFQNPADITIKLYSELEDAHYRDYFPVDGSNKLVKEG